MFSIYLQVIVSNSSIQKTTPSLATLPKMSPCQDRLSEFLLRTFYPSYFLSSHFPPMFSSLRDLFSFFIYDLNKCLFIANLYFLIFQRNLSEELEFFCWIHQWLIERFPIRPNMTRVFGLMVNDIFVFKLTSDIQRNVWVRK